MLKRTKYLIEKYWKGLLAFLGVAGAADLGKDFMRHEAMAWVSEKTGPWGSWLLMNPTAFLTSAIGLILTSLLIITLRDFGWPSQSHILDHNERPFNTPVNTRFTTGFVLVIILCLCCVGYGWLAYYRRAHVPPDQEQVTTVPSSPSEEDDDTSSAKPSSLDSDSQYELLKLTPQDKKKIDTLRSDLFRFKAQVLDDPDYFKLQKLKDNLRRGIEKLEKQHHCLIIMPENECLPKPPANVPAGDVGIDISLKVVATEMSESRYWVIHNKMSKLRIPIVLFVSLVNHDKEPLRLNLLYIEARDVNGWADVRMADSLFPSDHTMEQKPLILEAKNAYVSMQGEYLLPTLYERVIQPGDKAEGWIIAEYPKGFKYGSSIGEMRISLLSDKQWIASKTFSANPSVFGDHVELSRTTFYVIPLETLITERQ